MAKRIDIALGTVMSLIYHVRRSDLIFEMVSRHLHAVTHR